MKSFARYLLACVAIVWAVACVRDTAVEWAGKEFEVVVATGDAGQGQVAASHEKAGAGTVITVSATPAEGYIFSSWTVVGGEVILHPTANPVRFTMPARDVEIRAEFVKEPEPVEPEPEPLPEYNVTVSGDVGGSVVADRETAKEDDQVRVYAVAAADYLFAGWSVVSGDLVLEDAKMNPLVFVMTAGEVGLRAGFVVNNGYGVTVAPGENGTVKVDKARAKAGETVTLTAQAAKGYVFSRWKVVSGEAILSAAENPVAFTMPAGDVKIEGVFVPTVDSYSVVVDSDGHGVAEADTTVARQGETVALTALPFAGYAFSEWTVVGGDLTLDDPSLNPLTFAMPAGDVELRATFADEPEKPEPKYGVSVSSDGNGSVQADPETAGAGATVTLTAQPAEGYRFVRWVVVSENAFLNPTVNPARFTIPARDVEIRAEFAPLKAEHAITLSDDGHGTASANKTKATEGEKVTVIAKAADGYVFSRWTLVGGAAADLTTGSNPGTFTMPDGAVEVKVEFVVKPPDENPITVTDDGNGTASASAPIAKAGVPVTLLATPNPGYEFSRWVVVEGVDAVFLNDDRSPSARFIMPAATAELRAEFTKTRYNIVVSDDGNGKAEADKTGATMQEQVMLTATPDPGYEFSRWVLVDGEVTDLTSSVAPATFTMPIGAVEVRAEFVLKTLYIHVSTDGKGTASPDRPTAKMGETVSLTAAPHGSDYLFVGWKVLSGGVTVSGGAAASFTLSSENVEVMAQFVHIPREPFILHLDSNGRLAAGQWNDTATRDNILYFKLGSLVGVTTPASIPTETSWTDSRARTGFYNPTSIPETSFVNYYEDVPGYHVDDPVTDVSKDEYNTNAMALAGKGDACRLIGLTAEEALAMAQAGTLAAYNSGFRMPTYVEMDNDYVSGGSSWTTIGGMGGRWRNSAPDASTFLPAMGDRSRGGEVEEVGSMGTYWAANGINKNYGGGRCIEFYQGPNQISSPPWEYGFPIRCVRE